MYLGDLIFCNNSPIPAIYLILSGSIGANNGNFSTESPVSPMSPTKRFLSDEDKEDLIAKVGDSSHAKTMNPGEYIGVENFLDENKRCFKTFIAIKETSLCVISKDIFYNDKIFGKVRAQIMIDYAIRRKNKDRDALRRTISIRRLNLHLKHKQESFFGSKIETVGFETYRSSEFASCYSFTEPISEEERNMGIDQPNGLDSCYSNPRDSDNMMTKNHDNHTKGGVVVEVYNFFSFYLSTSVCH
jgi:CRP-like cAMP-binding protein